MAMSKDDLENTTEMNVDCEEPEAMITSEDVEGHEEPVLSQEQLQEAADLVKNDGNTFYKEKNYNEALRLYTKAIDMCPNCASFYGNRSATYMMIGRYDKALEDARSSVQIDPTFIKGYAREAKCHLAMGEAVAAINCCNKVIENGIGTAAVKQDLQHANALQQFISTAETSFTSRDYRRVVFCMERCIDLAPACKKFKIQKAESLALLKRYQEAQEIANDVLQFDSTNADAIYVRGLCLYYQDNTDKAFQHFQHVLRFAPDHPEAKKIYKKAKQLKLKKEAGNTAFKRNRLQEAYTHYTEALAIDEDNTIVNSKLYCNRAAVNSKTNKLPDAIADCTKAIELDAEYLKAYMRRAKCYMDTEQFDEAVRDYEKVNTLSRSREHQQLLKNAKLELKKSKRKDYYKILGCSKDADDDTIKKAYRKRALLHHPDRHANASDAEKKEEEKKFKEVGEAYTVLSDSKKRTRYDQGHDLEDLNGGGGFGGDIDPNSIFQAFFGGGAGPGYSYQTSHGGHGGHGSHGHGGGGFPGGFSFQFG